MSACIDENTASCENLHGSYICHCEPGYTGEQCETPATESPATDEQVGPHSPVRFFIVHDWDYSYFETTMAKLTPYTLMISSYVYVRNYDKSF